jgi:hypothetical protein
MVTVELSKRTIFMLRAFEKAAGVERYNKTILAFLDKAASAAAGHISDTMLSGQRLKRRTGTLAKSIIGRSLMFTGVPAMRIGVMRGPALKYAGPQEYGTKGKNPSSPYDTIRPRHGKALAIPMKPALTPAGVDRFGGPRNAGIELKFIPFRSTGVAVGGLFDPATLPPRGSGLNLRSAKMYYLLVKEIDLEPKWYLRDGFNDYLPILAEAILDYLEGIVRASGGTGFRGKLRDARGKFI